MLNDDIVVSVVCTTYNQREYIVQCLESLLNQVTSFRYEIIVHDDASTDGTSEIVREYAEHYPNVIVPIIEKENLYSKDATIMTQIIAAAIRGKYVAICEGDDFWLESNKLALQVNYMESNKDCSMCVHAVKVINGITDKEVGTIAPSNYERDFSTEELLEPPGSGSFFGTNSVMMRSKFYFRPTLYRRWGSVGDYPMFIYCSLKGRIHYYPGVLSAYRQNARNSFTSRMAANPDASISNMISVIDCLAKFDEDTKGVYHTVVSRAIQFRRVKIAVRNGDKTILADKEVVKWLETQSHIKKYFVKLACMSPSWLRRLGYAITRNPMVHQLLPL